MGIILRPISLNDGPFIVKWRNDDRVKSHCMSKSSITIESNEAFFHANVETGKYKHFIVDFIDRDFPMVSYPIASVYLKDMDYENKRCELCIFTSSDREWNIESQSMGIKLLLDKAFNEYGMYKVYSYIFSKFPEEVVLFEKAGFLIESILKAEALNDKGDYEDVIRMTIFKPE